MVYSAVALGFLVIVVVSYLLLYTHVVENEFDAETENIRDTHTHTCRNGFLR